MKIKIQNRLISKIRSEKKEKRKNYEKKINGTIVSNSYGSI